VPIYISLTILIFHVERLFCEHEFLHYLRQSLSRSLEKSQQKASQDPQGLGEEDRSLGGSDIHLNTSELEHFGGKNPQLIATWADDATTTTPTEDSPSTVTSTTPSTTTSTASLFIVYDTRADLFPGAPLGILNERQVEDIQEAGASTAPALETQTGSSPSENSNENTSATTTSEPTAASTLADTTTTEPITTQPNKRLKFKGQQQLRALFSGGSSSSSTTALPLLQTEVTRRTSFVPTSATEGRKETASISRWVSVLFEFQEVSHG
jgi:hypothetical protein